jgi:hypothetical protein
MCSPQINKRNNQPLSLKAIAINFIAKYSPIFKNKLPELPLELQGQINTKIAEDEKQKLPRERFF